MKLIALTQGRFAMVDDGDYEKLNQFRWYANYQHNNWYAIRRDGKEKIKMHRAIMDCKKGDGKILDHIDHNGLNCQRNNMRFCTSSGNAKNVSKQKNKSSKYLGVYLCRRNKNWKAAIRNNRNRIHLGVFQTEADAAKAYNKAAKIYHGEFANLNQI